jgi:hypothetical protein
MANGNMVYGHTPPFDWTKAEDNMSLQAAKEAERCTSNTEYRQMCNTLHQVVADMVNKPPHYTIGTIECIDYIKDVLTKEEYIGYLRGNVIKYQHRLRAKGNAAENAGKMNWYAKRLEEALNEAK